MSHQLRIMVCLLSLSLATQAWATDFPGQVETTTPTFNNKEKHPLTLDTSGNVKTSLGTLLSGEDQTNNLLMTSGGKVRSTILATGVTTNTTSVALALPTGNKSIYGSVDGTGAITQTQAIYGGLTSGVTTTTGQLLCTITLSGTTHAHDSCPPITANFLFYIVVTTNTTGTGATGVITGMY